MYRFFLIDCRTRIDPPEISHGHYPWDGHSQHKSNTETLAEEELREREEVKQSGQGEKEERIVTP